MAFPAIFYRIENCLKQKLKSNLMEAPRIEPRNSITYPLFKKFLDIQFNEIKTNN